MRRTSRKMAVLLRKYSKQRRTYLEANPQCARCGRPAIEIHHRAGRVGLRLLDESTWMAVCRDCHVRITEHPAEAIAEGWSLPRVGREAAS